jgi:hypothetical protein
MCVKTRKPLKPVTVNATWHRALSAANTGRLDGTTDGALTVNGTDYRAVNILDRGRVVGYQLVKRADGTVYSVCFDGHPSCDCADMTYRGHDRPNGCKHIQALRQLRAAPAVAA